MSISLTSCESVLVVKSVKHRTCLRYFPAQDVNEQKVFTRKISVRSLASLILDPGLNEKIFTDTAGSAMMDTPGKN